MLCNHVETLNVVIATKRNHCAHQRLRDIKGDLCSNDGDSALQALVNIRNDVRLRSKLLNTKSSSATECGSTGA
jgi:hypothetical protein